MACGAVSNGIDLSRAASAAAERRYDEVRSAVAAATDTPGRRLTSTWKPGDPCASYRYQSLNPSTTPAKVVKGIKRAGGAPSLMPANLSGATPMIETVVPSIGSAFPSTATLSP